MRLLYFHAKWCGPCKELNAKFMEKTNAIGCIKVERLDFDEGKERPFFGKFDVHSIPTLVLADESDEILWSHSGSDITLEQVEEKIKSLNKKKMNKRIRIALDRLKETISEIENLSQSSWNVSLGTAHLSALADQLVNDAKTASAHIN